MVLPEAFENYTRAMMGDDLFAHFAHSMQQDATAFVRLNHYKCPTAKMALTASKVPWYEYGYALEARPAFTFDPLFHAGLYYVQEQSSMFLAQILRQFVQSPVRMLDMCAAPGGKSTLARLELPKGSTLVCNEPNRSRVQILNENVQKYGHPEVMVTNNYPKEIRQSGLRFQVVLCDVPCSGEGMFRKNANAIDEWSVDNVNKCQQLQREIVAEAWQCLEPNGLLIYSTCTFNTKENEENVAWICQELGASTLKVKVEEDWNIMGNLLSAPAIEDTTNKESKHSSAFNVYRFIPGYQDKPGNIYGEGLFMAVLRKEGTSQPMKEKTSKQKMPRQHSDNKLSVPTHWLQESQHFNFTCVKNELWAIPPSLQSQYEQAARSLRVIAAGINLLQLKGKSFIPSQGLALSSCLSPTAFPRVELSYADAIQYLGRNTITLPPNTPQGFILVTYQNVALGFVKNMGNRANNLYPNEWRIRSTHSPENITQIITV